MLPSSRKSRAPRHTGIAELPFLDERPTDRKIQSSDRDSSSRYSSPLRRKLKPRVHVSGIPKTFGSTRSLGSSRAHPWDKQDDDDSSPYFSDSDDATALSSDYEGSIDTFESKKSSQGGFVFEKIHSVRQGPRLTPPTGSPRSKSPRRVRRSTQKHFADKKQQQKQSKATEYPITSPLRQPLHLQVPAPQRPLRRIAPISPGTPRSRTQLLSPRGPLSRRPPPAKEGPNAPTPKKSNTAISYTNRFLLGDDDCITSSKKNPINGVAKSTYEVDAPSTPVNMKKTLSLRLDAQFEQDSWSNNGSVGELDTSDTMYDDYHYDEDEDLRTRRTLEGTIEKLRAEASIISAMTRKTKTPSISHRADRVEELLDKTQRRLASYKARTNYYSRQNSFTSEYDCSPRHPRAVLTTRTLNSLLEKSYSLELQQAQVTDSSSAVGLTDIFTWTKPNDGPAIKPRAGKAKKHHHHKSCPKQKSKREEAPIWREAPIWSEDESKSVVSHAGEAPMWSEDESRSVVSYGREAPLWSEDESASIVSRGRIAPMWTGDVTPSPTPSAAPKKQRRKKSASKSTSRVDAAPPVEKDYAKFFAQLSATFSDDLAVASVETPPSDKDYLHFFAHLTQSRDLIFQDSKSSIVSGSDAESWRDDSPLPPSMESSVSSDDYGDDYSIESCEPVQFSASLEEAIKSETVVPTTRMGSRSSKRAILRWSEHFTQYEYQT